MKNIVETKIIDTVLEKSRIIINIAGTIKYIKFLFYHKKQKMLQIVTLRPRVARICISFY